MTDNVESGVGFFLFPRDLFVDDVLGIKVYLVWFHHALRTLRTTKPRMRSPAYDKGLPKFSLANHTFNRKYSTISIAFGLESLDLYRGAKRQRSCTSCSDHIAAGISPRQTFVISLLRSKRSALYLYLTLHLNFILVFCLHFIFEYFPSHKPLGFVYCWASGCVLFLHGFGVHLFSVMCSAWR